ncbi:MAG: SIR2 family NAD-dependent protein deacylase [Trueperaceae bacterium]
MHTALQNANTIAVLTGAGISAASGIPTFRGGDGLWKNYRAEDLATPEAYATHPLLVWEWYKMRFETVAKAKPNAAHHALAELAKTKSLTLVTQNVDGLHERGGSSGVLELHGNITQSRCERCKHLDDLQVGFDIPPRCSRCAARARPNVVWFGETLPQSIFQKAVHAFTTCDVAMIIGTSAVVEPAASLGRLAKGQGAFVIEINPTETPLSFVVDVSLRKSASEGLREVLGV